MLMPSDHTPSGQSATQSKPFRLGRLARELVAAHPEVDGLVQIDCMWAEVLTIPYVGELLSAWPEATFFNCNEEAVTSVTIVRQRRDSNAS